MKYQEIQNNNITELYINGQLAVAYGPHYFDNGFVGKLPKTRIRNLIIEQTEGRNKFVDVEFKRVNKEDLDTGKNIDIEEVYIGRRLVGFIDKGSLTFSPPTVIPHTEISNSEFKQALYMAAKRAGYLKR